MTAVAWGVVVAVIALAIGGVTVPIQLHRRGARQSRRASLTPAFDEIIQAVNRIRSVGSTVHSGFEAKLDEKWDEDVDLLKATGTGRFPVTNPSGPLKLACENTVSHAFFLGFGIRDHGRFNEETFAREFKRAVEHDANGLYRLIENEISGVARRIHVAGLLVHSCDELVRQLTARLNSDIQG